MSRLIRIFTVCLVSLFYPNSQKILNKQVRCSNLADHPNLPDFTQGMSMKALSEFFYVHSELIVKYDVGLIALLQQGISELICMVI